MTLVRYRPFRDMLSLQDEVNRVFDSLVRPGDVPRKETWSPTCDVRETETDYVVRAELPGVAREAVKINMIDNTLVIRGEKKQEEEEKKGTWHHVERTYGSFERMFALPTAVAVDRIKATYQEGVLEIHVPKAEEARPREIKIEG